MSRINLFLITFASIFTMTCQNNDENMSITVMPYPTTVKQDVVDNYHGTEVADPYRWLEVDTAKEVEAWVRAQNEVTFDYLNKIPFRQQLRDRYEELYNFTKLSAPRRVGNSLVYYKNDGLQNQAVIYIVDENGKEEVLLDPNTYSEAGTTAISIAGISKDDKYMAFSIQEAGSDWRTFKIMDIASRQMLEDELNWVKFSGAAWHKDGFFYSRYPEPEAGTELSKANSFHSVYYHRLGSDQSEDQLIYRDEQQPRMYHNTSVTEDGAYLILYKASGTDGYETWYKPLKEGIAANFLPLYEGFEQKNSVIDHRDGYFYVLTDVDAPNYRLVNVPVSNPGVDHWGEVIPESEFLLENVQTGGGKLYGQFLEMATHSIYEYNYDGQQLKQIALPGTGSVGGFGGKKEDKELYYTYTSFIYPPTIFKYDMESGESEKYFESDLAFDPEEYEEKQVFYPSKDGTMISMFIVHKKGLVLDGQRPTYLYGYGGFNISLTPSFSASRILLLENGGVFAMPNLRGGGEYGETWHEAGMLDKKQNVFDDFIAAAEYLKKENYTSTEKLAIAGRSNGGLLVGACMTQHPEMFQVAFPGVGVLDMLRYHKFTVGWGWVPEYGSSDEAEQFAYLYKYSPLHNLQEGQSYPATMITTADHDDRVVPAHSFKFAARLQEVQAGSAPVLIRIDTDAGHGAGKPTSMILDEQADLWSFFFYHTGGVEMDNK